MDNCQKEKRHSAADAGIAVSDGAELAREIAEINTLLILFGVGGMIRPTTTAMLHNISTVGISLQSMQNLPELKKV